MVSKKKRSPFEQQTDLSKTLHKNLEFTATEQYKLLRANLKFTLPEGDSCPIVGVTSSMRGEGKSTTSINTSYVLAETGAKTLLIDGDLRIPSVAKKLQIDGKPGLTDLLMGEMNVGDIKTQVIDTWYVLPGGDIPPNPSELLGSSRMSALLEELKKHFDYIVIDLPPVNLVPDALSVSKLISGMILVVREGYTQKKEVEQCIRQLKLSNVNVLGCVMTNSGSSGGYYSKYKKDSYYKHYGDYSKKNEKEERAKL